MLSLTANFCASATPFDQIELEKGEPVNDKEQQKNTHYALERIHRRLEKMKA